jgi:hypothetical protein
MLTREQIKLILNTSTLLAHVISSFSYNDADTTFSAILPYLEPWITTMAND